MRNLLEQICARHGLNVAAFDEEIIDDDACVRYFAHDINAIVELSTIDQTYRVWGPDNEFLFSGTWTSILS